MTNFEKLMNKWNEINKLSSCSALLGYDEQVGMPSNGSDYRSDVSSLISTMIAKKLNSKHFLNLINTCKNETLTNEQSTILSDIEDTVKFSNRIPVKLHGQLSKMSSVCHAEWEKVKHGADDKKYIETLTKFVDLIKESINFANKGEFSTSYDYLLDGYSKGFTTTQIDSLFSGLKPFIDSSLTKFDSSFSKTFDAEEMKVMDFCRIISNKITGAPNTVNLSKSTHPFCTTLGRNDVRITTRIKPGNILDAIGSTVHESGHAAYECGIDSNNFGNILGSAASIAAHEGISLFYEKHVGECQLVVNEIANYFEFDASDVLEWMREINPKNLIRTESDEITYQRHIINRFTIEKELFNGNLKVSEIPSRWNELYGQDLAPSVGYACDVHWAGGSFGYFPSYSIGHMIAAQLRNKMENEITMFGTEVNYEGIRNWLYEHYFVHGGRYKTPELVKIATGEELNSSYWINYISSKFGI